MKLDKSILLHKMEKNINIKYEYYVPKKRSYYKIKIKKVTVLQY